VNDERLSEEAAVADGVDGGAVVVHDRVGDLGVERSEPQEGTMLWFIKNISSEKLETLEILTFFVHAEN
jgi:hypothetical protein